MARRQPTSKFVGDTKECFAHLFAGKSDPERFALHKLIGGFCDIEPDAVSRWERGREIIRGTSLLRLRCFLHLAGYEVTEVDGYSELKRSLLLIVGLRVIEDPYVVQRRLGYGDSGGLKPLYHIILRNKGYSPEVGEEIVKLCGEFSDKLNKALAEKGGQIRQALKDLTVQPQKLATSLPPASSEPPDQLAVTAFARSVGLTLALGAPLMNNPAAAQAVRQATRGGLDLDELQAMLEKLLP